MCSLNLILPEHQQILCGHRPGYAPVDLPLILDDHGPQNYNPQPFLEGMWVAVLRYLTNHPH